MSILTALFARMGVPERFQAIAGWFALLILAIALYGAVSGILAIMTTRAERRGAEAERARVTAEAQRRQAAAERQASQAKAARDAGVARFDQKQRDAIDAAEADDDGDSLGTVLDGMRRRDGGARHP
jgi:hypothetical protein